MECTTLGDAVRLVRVRAQQIEDTAQGADQQWQREIGQLNQQVQAVQRGNTEAKDTLHWRADLLDLRLQKVEETAQSWASIQRELTVLQGEVTTMKVVLEG